MASNSPNRSLLLASNFLVSCGLVLLKGPLPAQAASSSATVIVLENKRAGSGVYVLPKGRTEPGEKLAETAVRETTEETGYPCRLLPLPVPSQQPNISLVNTEPLGIQMRRIRPNLLKIVYFFAGITTGEMGQRAEEELDYDVLELGIDDAIQKLTHKEDRDLVNLVKTLLEAKEEKL